MVFAWIPIIIYTIQLWHPKHLSALLPSFRLFNISFGYIAWMTRLKLFLLIKFHKSIHLKIYKLLISTQKFTSCTCIDHRKLFHPVEILLYRNSILFLSFNWRIPQRISVLNCCNGGFLLQIWTIQWILPYVNFRTSSTWNILNLNVWKRSFSISQFYWINSHDSVFIRRYFLVFWLFVYLINHGFYVSAFSWSL